MNSGTLYLEETKIGYVIREEQVVKGNNYKNGMEQIKNEGEKTAKNDSIYRYYSKNEEKLKTQISELDEKIQEALKGQKLKYPIDIKLLENQLDERIQLLSKETDISAITEYHKKISSIVTKKSKMIGELSTAGTYLKQLYDERTKLEEQLNSGAEYISAPVSGIVSYKVDGLEEILVPDNFSSLSKHMLENLKLKTGQLIATNNECGKIINSDKCYIATITDSEASKNAKLGDKVQIRLSNNKIIDSKIEYISQENEDEKLIIFMINREIKELANYRKISFDLIWWNDKGLKVPNQAIIEQDGLNYVVKNRAGYLSKVLIKIKKTNGKYSIVSNYSIDEFRELGIPSSQMKSISLYDELMLNPNLNEIE